MTFTAHVYLDYKSHLFMWQTLFGTNCVHTIGWVLPLPVESSLVQGETAMGTDNTRWLS